MPRRANVPDEALEHALWWVSRWVSGSMRDPDWSWPEAEAMGAEEAFRLVRERIGNGRSVGGEHWRYLDLDEAGAARIEAGGDLLPHERSPFQSFTGSYALAREFGEYAGGSRGVGVAVRVAMPPDRVMFGMADLLADRRAAPTMRTLDLWHHQGEVVALVDAPLKVLEVRRLDWSDAPSDPDGDDEDVGLSM